MSRYLAAIILAFVLTRSAGQTPYQKDFDHFWKTIQDNYAYFDRQQINWSQAKNIYQPLADSCSSRNSLIRILESALNELYNGHNFLNTNTSASNRLIPSGADLKVIYQNGQFIIDETRPGFNAEHCGLKKGMTVTAFNGQPVNTAIRPFLPKAQTGYSKAMYEYAANMLLAGTHDTRRTITVQNGGSTTNFFPDNIPNRTESSFPSLLEWKKLDKNMGYIRINNSLGDDGLISAFDAALDSLWNTNGLVLDLRETAGGGTTVVARAMMGRFIIKEMPYQKHIYTAEERESGIRRSTLELVSPRGKTYKKPLVVLVSYWTGSMGEGIAIGFDALHRATVAGTTMAGLLGEIYTFETPGSKIPFSFPPVQLQTVAGQPREDFIPPVLLNNQGEAIQKAIGLLTNKK